MLDATFAWMLIPLAFHLAGRPPARGRWTLGGSEPFYRAYRCKDGRYFSVGNLEPWLWQNLLDALGEEEPSNERLEALFATRTRDEWGDALAEVDSCLAPVNTLAEALEDPQLRHRGMLADGLLGLPFRLSGAESRPVLAGRPRGADTDAVLRELEVTAAEIERLRSEGTI
jgi:alpha-methylacyl-CoA racemase